MVEMRRAWVLAASCFWLASCAGGPGLGGAGARSAGSYASGSTLGASLSGRDVAALNEAFVEALDKTPAGGRATWSGPGASGAITPGARRAGNLRADPNELLEFRPGLKLSHLYETDLGDFVLTRNSNVRYGPSTDEKVAEVLPSGTGVEVIGRVVGEPWMLIARDGVISGFVFEDLMVRRPGTELELAGGPTRRPRLCRSFAQTLSVDGRTDRWSGVACDAGSGWVLSAPARNSPTRLF